MISKNSKFQKRRGEQVSGTLLGGFFVALFCGVALFLIANNIVLNQKRTELESKANDLKIQLEELQKAKANLEQGIGDAQTQEYQEKILREQGLYKKPGEEVVTILPSQDQAQEKNTKSGKVWWDPRTWF
ncbi:MAG: hypothetical protein Q7S63_01500 [bacterium]|nr:hypothetical protein [bacterium]